MGRLSHSSVPNGEGNEITGPVCKQHSISPGVRGIESPDHFDRPSLIRCREGISNMD